MKLNKECIRDLMLFVENLDTPSASQQSIMEFVSSEIYSKEEVLYTIKKLDEAGYLSATFNNINGSAYWFNINSITYEGHQFIDTIRDDSVWSHVKQKSSKFKDVSISVLSQLGVAYVKSELSL